MNDKRLLSLDFSRGLAIILVVWAHADVAVMAPAFYARNLKFIHEIIYSFHLPLFFLISAALLKKSIDTNHLDFLPFLQKLTKSLLIPFFALGLIFLVIRSLAPGSLLQDNTAGNMLQALLLHQFDIENLPSGVLWFLFSLYLFALLAYLLLEILKIPPSLVLGLAVVLKLFQFSFPPLTLFALFTIPLFFVFFVVGYLQPAWVLAPKIVRPFLVFPSLLLLWAVAFYYLPYYPSLAHIFCGLAAGFLILGLSVHLNHSPRQPLLRILYFCGSNSMLIFVLHTSFFVFLKSILVFLQLNQSFLGFGLAVAGGVALPLLVGKLLGQLPVYRFLFGRPYVPY